MHPTDGTRQQIGNLHKEIHVSIFRESVALYPVPARMFSQISMGLSRSDESLQEAVVITWELRKDHFEIAPSSALIPQPKT